MSYNLRAFLEHTDLEGTLHRIEFRKEGYGGGVLELIGDAGRGVFDFEHEEVGSEGDAIFKIHEKPIIKGRLELFAEIGDATDFAFLQDVAATPENDYIVVWKQDGNEFWTAHPTTRILKYPERAYPFTATISAKDFNILESIDYMPGGALPDERKPIIEVFAELLSYTNYNLDIKTATSWVESHGDAAEDYLRQNYYDTFALRNYGSTGEEEDTSITVWEALKQVANDNKVFLKQAGNEFLIDQITAHEDPTSVLVNTYDSDGVWQSKNTVDVTIATSADFKVLDTSENAGYPAVKRATVTFDHRTQGAQLQVPSSIYLTGFDDQVYSRPFISTGNQELRLSGSVWLASDEEHDSGEVELRIWAGQYYWDGEQWDTDNTNRVTVDVFGDGQLIEGPDTDFVYSGQINVRTTVIPSDATTPLEITFYSGLIHAGPDIVADQTSYENLLLAITDPSDSNDQSTAIDYQLTQQPGHTESYNSPPTWYGDGPTPSARSAIRYGTDDGDFTNASWQRRGSVNYRNYHENFLKECLDPQRDFLRSLRAELYGVFDPTKDLAYDAGYFFYLGGRFSGYNGVWTIKTVEIAVSTTSQDEFGLKYRFSATGGSSSGGGGGGGGTTAPSSWGDVTGKPFKMVKTTSGHFVIDEGELQLPQALGEDSTVTHGEVRSKGEVTGFYNGGGAQTSPGVYGATILNLNDSAAGTAQINRNGTPLWVSGKINDTFLPDDITAGSVEWTNITGNPFDGYTPSDFATEAWVLSQGYITDGVQEGDSPTFGAVVNLDASGQTSVIWRESTANKFQMSYSPSSDYGYIYNGTRASIVMYFRDSGSYLVEVPGDMQADRIFADRPSGNPQFILRQSGTSRGSYAYDTAGNFVGLFNSQAGFYMLELRDNGQFWMNTGAAATINRPTAGNVGLLFREQSNARFLFQYYQGSRGVLYNYQSDNEIQLLDSGPMNYEGEIQMQGARVATESWVNSQGYYQQGDSPTFNDIFATDEIHAAGDIVGFSTAV